jgi:hypothetical protein
VADDKSHQQRRRVPIPLNCIVRQQSIGFLFIHESDGYIPQYWGYNADKKMLFLACHAGRIFWAGGCTGKHLSWFVVA